MTRSIGVLALCFSAVSIALAQTDAEYVAACPQGRNSPVGGRDFSAPRTHLQKNRDGALAQECRGMVCRIEEDQSRSAAVVSFFTDGPGNGWKRGRSSKTWE